MSTTTTHGLKSGARATYDGGLQIRKRSGHLAPFSVDKIVKAVKLCLVNGCGRPDDPKTHDLSVRVADRITSILVRNPVAVATVEQVQDLAEMALMAFGEHEAAKQYILFREERRRRREEENAKPVSIFRRREAFKPFEYDDVTAFKTSIQHAYWTVDEFNFLSDYHEFNTKLAPHEKTALTRALLAISQIEVSVKRFWANIGQRFPKAEIEQVGMTFAESEVRHADAYSHLLQVLGLDRAFDDILKVPAIRARVDYLQDSLRGAAQADNDEYTLMLALFSLFVENVSLFSQFAIVKSFNKHRQILKDVDNVVQATQKEEQIHALFGAQLVNYVRAERPSWFNADFYARVADSARRALAAETKILDWIFADGELEFLPKAALVEFIKHRLNTSVQLIGGAAVFDVDQEQLDTLQWFNEESVGDLRADFFHKRPVTYTQGEKAYDADSLF